MAGELTGRLTRCRREAVTTLFRSLRIRGYRILGRGEDLEGVASQTEAETLILAVSEASPQFLADLDARARSMAVSAASRMRAMAACSSGDCGAGKRTALSVKRVI